jgi:hypothetical protein
MNITVILLGIVIILLVYVLYKYVTKPSALTTDLVDLNKSTQSIPVDKIVGNSSARYSYASWIYVNSWSTNSQKNLISRGSDMRLYLDTTTPSLKYEYMDTASTPASQTIIITNDLPLQKWVYVIVNIDGSIMDAYIDGKLVISKKLSTPPKISAASIDLGKSGNPQDIYLAKVSRWDKVIDPQTAWNYYMEGNGISNGVLPNYNVKVGLYKDNSPTKEFSLF